MSTWRDLPRPEVKPPERLSAGLDRVARQLGAPGAAVLAALFDRWDEIAGPGLAPRSRPLWLARGTLVVGVGDPTAATEVRYRANEILDRVEQAAGRRVAERLEVRVRARR